MGLHVVLPAMTVPIQFVGAIRTGQTDDEVLVTYMGVQQGRVLGKVASGGAGLVMAVVY